MRRNILSAIKINFQNKIYGGDRDFSLFLAVGFLAGIGGGINSTIFNNFLSDTYNLSSSARGIVEFPREFPGVCIMFVLAILSALGDIRIAALGLLAASAGMLGLGLFSPTFGSMIVFLMIFSLGTHIMLPLQAGIGMSLSQPGQYGARLGKYSAYGLYATIISYIFVWAGFKYFGLSYQVSFAVAAVFYLLAAFVCMRMKPQAPHHKKVTLVFRRKYTLYYVLSIVNGARKQIFLTFAPWVLIKVFSLDTSSFAVLGLMVAFLSIFTRKFVGGAIDRLGERAVLSGEAIILIVICLGYAFAGLLLPAGAAVVVIAGCYVLDNSMSVVEMARSTYVRKIAVDSDDVTHTLSTGTSLDHMVSMTIPFFGGLLWAACGYQAVFLAAALIAVTNLILSRFIKVA